MLFVSGEEVKRLLPQVCLLRSVSIVQQNKRCMAIRYPPLNAGRLAPPSLAV